MNSVLLAGNLGQDPEVRFTPSGTAVCTASIATNESWKDKETGVKEQRTEWHRLVIWGKRGENFVEFFRKGDGVIIEGKLQTRSWEGDDGIKRYTTEIVVQKWHFPPGKSHSNRPPEHTDEDAPRYIPGEDEHRTGRGDDPVERTLIPDMYNSPPLDDDVPF